MRGCVGCKELGEMGGEEDEDEEKEEEVEEDQDPTITMMKLVYRTC